MKDKGYGRKVDNVKRVTPAARSMASAKIKKSGKMKKAKKGY